MLCDLCLMKDIASLQAHIKQILLDNWTRLSFVCRFLLHSVRSRNNFIKLIFLNKIYKHSVDLAGPFSYRSFHYFSPFFLLFFFVVSTFFHIPEINQENSLSLGVLICLDTISIFIIVLDSFKNDISTVKKFSTVSKMTSRQ